MALTASFEKQKTIYAIPILNLNLLNSLNLQHAFENERKKILYLNIILIYIITATAIRVIKWREKNMHNKLLFFEIIQYMYIKYIYIYF